MFTDYFLTHGIKDTPEWKASMSRPEAFAAFRDGVARRHEALGRSQDPNEAQTEQDLVRPVLELLGWTDYLPQQGTEDVPDHLLFADAESRAQAETERDPGERIRYAAVVQESKRFGLSLDARNPEGRTRTETPHRQILRYLSTAENVSDGRVRWGILTNGDVWRLYDGRARPRDNGYFEVDLGVSLRSGNDDHLRAFHLLFGREAFTLRDGARTTFLETALAEGRRYEEQVARDLSGVVFHRVFPGLVRALADRATEALSEIRQAALIFLYRLLFVFYAEDRGLLPVNDSRYDDYGARKRVRDDVARRTADGDAFSAVATDYHDRLTTLFRLVDKGDESIGLPPYDGGLFGSEAAPLLDEVRLPDASVAPIIHDLSHVRDVDGKGPRFVNYRDMSVQQLGSIYERLLEQEPVRDEDGVIVVRPNPYARKDSGSFFTPQELVDLIVDRTLKPLVEERREAFERKAVELRSDRRPKARRKAELLEMDPAEAVLNLKVLDPSMGSGHFLVTAVDFIADAVAELVEHAPVVPEWLDGDYVSPLMERVAAIRGDLLQRARESGWVLDEAQLTDSAIIRRMVLKRCIYGVDKNPLTVELAKVSLWLHSFTVGAPLSFLDHHLRCGDSLVGMRVAEATEDLRKFAVLFFSSAIAATEAASRGMERIEELSDADISEVQESANLFAEVDKSTAGLRGLLDFLCGFRWLTAGKKKKDRAAFETPLVEILGQHLADAWKLLVEGPDSLAAEATADDNGSRAAFKATWEEARSIARRERFLHWDLAFPGVWRQWHDPRPAGGFDAVIGNPPWDRIKLQEVEWLATRDPTIAHSQTAAERQKRVQQLRQQGAPLASEFDDAKAEAESLKRMVCSHDYPLLGRGDINLYSLFVERAMHLVKPDGFVGLLTPSGICGDKTAAPFFRMVSTCGRVAALFDFQNQPPSHTGKPRFFPAVHPGLKFCAVVFGGEERSFPRTDCAFFLDSAQTIRDPHRCFSLTPTDFARINPNTGTAPVFRTRRDAEITSGVYERHPVLVDRSTGVERRTWPVRYVRMFDMTIDSGLFRIRTELEADGFYPVQGNRWKRGEELCWPLYEGKMVQAFDHRAASVVVNPDNLNRPAQPRYATREEHADPNWLPSPQFWVRADALEWPWRLDWVLGFKEITAPTNMRTMIGSLLPKSGFGNKMPVFLPAYGDPCDTAAAYKDSAPFLVANFNSLAFDFVTRQKVHGQTLNLYIVEQLPVIAPDDYNRRFGNATARDLVRDHVLRLTYTAHDMVPFARDLGYDGSPFIWDDEERRHLRARLDALYFHLYGINRDDAEYILGTFPIVRREDEAGFGHYRTRDLILAYMNALAAGDTESVVTVGPK